MSTIKQSGKTVIHKNLYISDFFTRMKGIRQNDLVRNIERDCENVDSILHYDEFKEVMNNDIQKGISLTKRCYGGESLLYGHLNALYNYSNVGKKDIRAFAKLEHGIDTYASIPSKEDISFVGNFVFQGRYKEKAIHKINGYKPVFTVGPYIHYANLVYDKHKLTSIKKKWGKTLLVFPFHCYEFSVGSYDDELFVKYVMNSLAKEFDTVLISVYWNDINDPIYQKFKSYGATLVSSGFRGDQNFINRQKTLFYLTDAVCGNSFGTQIGYAMCLNKPYLYIDTGLTYTDDKHIRKASEIEHHQHLDASLRKAFSSFEPDELLKSMQLDLYNEYWGGDACLKEPQAIAGIIEIGEMIFHAAHGFKDNFDFVVRDMLDGKIALSEEANRQLDSSLGGINR